jgi:hypothetical protein
LLEEKIPKSKVKRIPASGAIGTSLGEPLLTGDVKLEVPCLPRKLKIEAKVGYGGETQLTVKKEWLDKIKMEAKNDYSYPLLACKFSGSRAGVRYFISMDFDTFCDIINYMNELKTSLDISDGRLRDMG